MFAFFLSSWASAKVHRIGPDTLYSLTLCSISCCFLFFYYFYHIRSSFIIVFLFSLVDSDFKVKVAGKSIVLYVGVYELGFIPSF